MSEPETPSSRQKPGPGEQTGSDGKVADAPESGDETASGTGRPSAKKIAPGRSSRTEVSRPPRRRRLALGRGERRILLHFLDLAALNGALLLYLHLRPDPDQLGSGFAGSPMGWRLLLAQPIWFLLISALWLPIAHAFDAYRTRTASDVHESAVAAAKAAIATVIVYLLIPYMTPTLPPSRWYLGSFAVLTLSFVVGIRVLYAMVMARPYFDRPTLIVGAGWAGRTITQVILREGEGVYRIVGFIDDDPDKLGARVRPPETDDDRADVTPLDRHAFTVLGDRIRLRELVEAHDVRSIVLAITGEIDPEMFEALNDCLEAGVEILPMPRLHEQLTGRVPVEHVGGHWHIVMPLEHPGSGAVWPLVKRTTDVVLASVGLVLLGLALPFIALAIYLDSPGPIFYTQKRVGRGGTVYDLFKFRSMQPEAEENKAVWARPDDPRVTRVGRLLRKTHVDEFPQFLNILRGEMSAVGPRPERPDFLEELTAEIPFYSVRHAAKPGMAGWALVNLGYGASKRDTVLKLQYDLYYIKHQSLWLDFIILLKTFAHSLGLQGR